MPVMSVSIHQRDVTQKCPDVANGFSFKVNRFVWFDKDYLFLSLGHG